MSNGIGVISIDFAKEKTGGNALGSETSDTASHGSPASGMSIIQYGLFSRRVALRARDVWAPRLVSAAARHDFSIWVVMADLNLFKKVNDTFGHDSGDTVLKSFAKILKANTRQSNICARLGGEEFLVMITHADKQDAKTIVERIRKHFESKKFVSKNSTTTMTASFEIAGFRGTELPEFNVLVSRADTALYAAKHIGGNRVEFEPASSENGM